MKNFINSERMARNVGTVLRSELSEKSVYWIEKHRYLELKNFCRQYSVWKEELRRFDSLPTEDISCREPIDNGYFGDPTVTAAMRRERYSRWVALVERAARDSIRMEFERRMIP